MSAIYREELVEKAGLAESRAYCTEHAVGVMHSALSKMDNRNRAAFLAYVEQCGGFLGLMQRFAELEQLNDFR
jgi:hypothetical protein